MTPPKTGLPYSERFEEGFAIPEPALALIQERLSKAEEENQVKILYACETGSRGWGFASADSDFDVRFVYVHEQDWYLCVAPDEKRDVLEPGIENTHAGELDINGWDLRKSLNLFRKSNPGLLEWLSSPSVYRERGIFAPSLREAAIKTASPIRLWHHYRGAMESCITRYQDGRATIKAWFYIMRPLLAMRWIEMEKGVPPMRFDRLMDGVIEDKGLREELDRLVALKRSRRESDDFAPPSLISSWVESETRRLKENPPELLPAKEKAEVDSLFREILTGS
ncbi:hypothetical protein FACS1894205_4350 [Alphaproteobacteria bacterium]|nr:hypothetical protein FACS1894205_4350 [Alphaproteobacteria bacterium]